ncbi:histone deacetylase 2-like [Rosa rugosa]|uniref:histone deacetylase 2-like n=1 Tax=Rosa rugosa TaxID=74645 RepID=UPI002B408455|nr:histone deacetylase 2-like [Rosa rugosa]
MSFAALPENDAKSLRRSRILSSKLYFDVPSSKVKPVSKFVCAFKFTFRNLRISPSFHLGIEKLHPFDSAKWGRICRFLSMDDVVDKNCIVEPKEAAKEDLVHLHTEAYLNSLKESADVAIIINVPPVALFPNCLVQQKVLSPPFHNQVGEPSWLQSLQKSEDGPSMWEDWVYHCCGGKGGGFCAYTDISLCIHFVQVRLNIFLKGDDY